LIEALALGRPALVTASGGNVDIIEPERTGLLFSPDNAEDLARQLRRLLSQRLSLANPARIRQSVEIRHPARVARQYRELYESILRNDPNTQDGSCKFGVHPEAP
jgi:phosphatidylinositol alpha 1,6-mannosyltransferase